MAKYCAKCGQELEDTARFCGACGELTYEPQINGLGNESMNVSNPIMTNQSKQTMTKPSKNKRRYVPFVIVACISLLVLIVALSGNDKMVKDVSGTMEDSKDISWNKKEILDGTAIEDMKFNEVTKDEVMKCLSDHNLYYETEITGEEGVFKWEKIITTVVDDILDYRCYYIFDFRDDCFERVEICILLKDDDEYKQCLQEAKEILEQSALKEYSIVYDKEYGDLLWDYYPTKILPDDKVETVGLSSTRLDDTSSVVEEYWNIEGYNDNVVVLMCSSLEKEDWIEASERIKEEKELEAKITAADREGSWKKLYTEYFSDRLDSINYYELVDYNKDGIPEVIINNSSDCDENANALVYVNKLGEVKMSEVGVLAGDDEYVICGVQDGEEFDVFVYEYDSEMADYNLTLKGSTADDSYIINGEESGEEEFAEELEKIGASIEDDIWEVSERLQPKSKLLDDIKDYE